MRVTTSKSKNAESFYISKGYVNDKGVSTSVIIRKLGTLKDLLPEHGPTRDDVTGLRHLREIKITINRRNAGFFMSNFIYFYVVWSCILSLYVI